MPNSELHFLCGTQRLNICHETQIVFISNAKIHLYHSGFTVRFIEKCKQDSSFFATTFYLFFLVCVCYALHPPEVVKVGGVPPVSPPTLMANLHLLGMWLPHDISISQVGLVLSSSAVPLYKKLYFHYLLPDNLFDPSYISSSDLFIFLNKAEFSLFNYIYAFYLYKNKMLSRILPNHVLRVFSVPWIHCMSCVRQK